MGARLGIATVIAALSASAAATASGPLTMPTQERWERNSQGHVFYVAKTPDERLAAVCVDVGDGGLWLPEAVLADIREPRLHDVRIILGMGFAKSDRYVPDQPLWGPSLEIPTDPQEGDVDDEGPEYSFILHRGVPWRVRREWIPMTADEAVPGGVSRQSNDGARARQDEQWLAIDTATVRQAPCRPPEAPAFVYLWPEDRAVEVDLDRDGVGDHARLGLGNHGVALQVRVGGKDLPMIEIPADASRQFGICRSDDGEPTIRVAPQSPAPQEALGEMPGGYEVCDDCKEIVVSGGECDPLHFYWNRATNQLNWWRT